MYRQSIVVKPEIRSTLVVLDVAKLNTCESVVGLVEVRFDVLKIETHRKEKGFKIYSIRRLFYTNTNFVRSGLVP